MRRRADQEPVPDADLHRRAAPAAVGDRLRAGPGARLGDARRGRRRRLPRHPRRGGRDGPAGRGRLSCPTPSAADAYDRLYAEYTHACTTTSAGAATTCCTGSARSERGPAATRRSGDRDRGAVRRPCCRPGPRSAALHAELPRCGPGGLDERATSAPGVPGADLMVIKPSGVVLRRADARSRWWSSTWTAAGRGRPVALQRHRRARRTSTGSMPDVGGVVHTHSPYATAWAARARGDPVRADRDGRRVRRRDPARPVRPDRQRGDRARASSTTLTGHRSPAVLMPATACSPSAKTAKAAVKAAVMCEDVARTMHLARALAPGADAGAGGRRLALRPLPERLRAALSRLIGARHNNLDSRALRLFSRTIQARSGSPVSSDRKAGSPPPAGTATLQP